MKESVEPRSASRDTFTPYNSSGEAAASERIVQAAEVPLDWSRSDIEQRVGFRGARFTRVNSVLSFILAVLISVAYYAALMPFKGTWFSTMFNERGPTQYFTVLF